MERRNSVGRGYVWAALLGAIAGGLAVAIVTRAIPKMMSETMRSIMAQMREGGCNMADL